MSMQPYVVILAGTVQEGRTYARRKGLVLSRCRVVANASSVRGLRSAEIHELPSFSKRLDRHSINAQLRYVKGNGRILVEMPPPIEAPPVDQGDGMGEQLTIDDALGETEVRAEEVAEEAVRAAEDLHVAVMETFVDNTSEEQAAAVAEVILEDNGLVEYTTGETHGEQTGTPEPSEDAAPPAEKPKATRRRRCPDCGALVPDLDAHACPQGDENGVF